MPGMKFLAAITSRVAMVYGATLYPGVTILHPSALIVLNWPWPAAAEADQFDQPWRNEIVWTSLLGYASIEL